MTDHPSQPKGNKPIETLRDGALKLSIFRNQRDNGESYAMEAGRIYTDQNGTVREAKSFSQNEALRMSRLFDKGYDRIDHFKEMRKQQKPVERER